jgi:Alpha galactosidase C-terminal beta sandwich domain
VVLFNRHHPEYPLHDVTVTWDMLGYEGSEEAVVRDLFARSDLGRHAGENTPHYVLTSDVAPMDRCSPPPVHKILCRLTVPS